MSILYEKLITKYSNKLYHFFDHRTTSKLKTKELPLPNTISNKIDFDYIDYTCSDFAIDYTKYSDYKEIEMIFKIIKTGVGIHRYAENRNFNIYNFISILKNGIDYYNEVHIRYFYEFIPKNFDLSRFEVILYAEHCEIYGDYYELLEFKETNKIKDGVIFDKFKNKYHIAFNGYLFNEIRKRTI